MTVKSGPERWERDQDATPVFADLGRRKYVVFGYEMRADRAEDLWWYANGDVERVHEVSCIDE